MALSIQDFAKLMIAQLVKNSKTVYFKKISPSIASIPFNYRERIENILCTNNGWKEEFSVLIDMDEYFYDHFAWEEKLAREIQKFADDPIREMYFDIISEYIFIVVKPSDVEEILSKYDEETINTMKHFVNIMSSHIYSRKHKEELVDYSARATAIMHEIYLEAMEKGIRF